MKRLTFVALLAAALLAACGSSTKTAAPKQACHPSTPPRMGECIEQHYGLQQLGPLSSGKLSVGGSLCEDWSQWQGSYPSLAGVHCVIIQSNYGLHVEPTVYSQIRDANEHHVPWGVYTFAEGNSGASEARLAVQVSSGRGRTLGVWFDAEIGVAYAHACAYTAQARAMGVFPYGVYSAPGLYAGGHCAGFLWPAEWGVSGPYPFAGYPYSAIKLWQFCGTCAIDLNHDRGLIALGHPTPPKPKPTHTQLIEYRAKLRRLLTIHRCRVAPLHGRGRYHHPCAIWLREGQRVNRELGVR